MPFLEEVGGLDVEMAAFLARLAGRNEDVLNQVIAHSALAGDAAADIAGAVLFGLQQMDAEAAGAVETLPWAEDGVADGLGDRSGTIVELANSYLDGPESFRSEVAGLFQQYGRNLMGAVPWVQDGVGGSEEDAAAALAAIAGRVPAILESPWIRDGMDRRETEAARILAEVTQFFPSVIELLRARDWAGDQSRWPTVDFARAVRDDPAILELPWIVDGATRSETESVFIMARGVQHYPAMLEWPWILDGANSSEAWVAADFGYAVQDYPALLDWPWIADGITFSEAEAAWYLSQAVQDYPAVFDLPWIQDGVDLSEAQAAADLGYAVRDYPAILELPWLADGITPSETETARYLAQGIQNYPAVLELPWIQDGVDLSEVQAAADLGYAVREYPAILELSWLADGITPFEAEAASYLAQAVRNYPPVLELPWIQDGVDLSEARAAAELGYAVREHPAILELPWLTDGITPSEAEAAWPLAQAVQDYPAVLELPWVQDGVSLTEAWAAAEWSYAVREYPAILELPWLADGVTRSEAESTRTLANVAEEVPSILGMPFLQEWDTLDVAALRALRRLSWSESRENLDIVLSHPSLSGGITDDWTNIIASIGILRSRPDLIEVLLDPERTHVEERVVTLPNTGEVRLSVIRPGKTASEVVGSRAMELLEQAIRSQEEFMGVAFPLDHAVILDTDPRPLYGPSYGGTNVDGIIVTQHVDNHGLIAHELAHTYWRGEASWLNEGGASFLDVISRRDYDGTPLPDSEAPCTLFDSLYDMEHSDVSFEELYFESGCPYSLGRGIFRELYERLGDEAARRGFGRLYLALRDDSYDDVCAGDDRNGCYVQEAFLEGATPEQAAIVDGIIARRYYGPNRTPAPG